MLALIVCLLILTFMYYSCLTGQKPDIWANIDYVGRWIIKQTPGTANWVADKTVVGANWVADKTPGAVNWVADKTVVGANWVADKTPGAVNWMASQATNVLDRTKDAANWVAGKVPDAADEILVAGQWMIDNAPSIKNPLADKSKNTPVSNVIPEPSQNTNGVVKDSFTQSMHDDHAMALLSKNPAMYADTNSHKIAAMDSLGSSMIRPYMN